jgi:hypothetical protein
MAFWTFLIISHGLVRFFPRSTALERFAFGGNLAKVFRATFGSGLAALSAEGHGVWVFSHDFIVQETLAVVKEGKCINSC